MTRGPLLVTVTALLCVTCGHGTDPDAATTVVGTYQLKTINGNPLPGYAGPTGAPEILSRGLTLRVDGTVEQVENHRHPYPPFESDFEVLAGTYTRASNAVEMHLPSQTVVLQFTNGNTLTHTYALGDLGVRVLVYRK